MRPRRRDWRSASRSEHRTGATGPVGGGGGIEFQCMGDKLTRWRVFQAGIFEEFPQ